MNIRSPFILIPLLISHCLLQFSCRTETSNSSRITIAAAANMQFAIEELRKAFTEKHQIECELVISSSGKLTAQIKEGAPYELLLAANMKYPEEIFHSGLAVEAPRVYAYGKLVLWTLKKDVEVSIPSLENDDIRHIALANPKTAPYGSAAIELLEHYGLRERLQAKLVLGESIAQTNQFITSKSAEIGFTAMSVVVSPKMQNQGNWALMDEKLYSPINQGVVLIKRDKARQALARQFYDFLFSAEAKEILKNFGYSVNE